MLDSGNQHDRFNYVRSRCLLGDLSLVAPETGTYYLRTHIEKKKGERGTLSEDLELRK